MEMINDASDLVLVSACGGNENFLLACARIEEIIQRDVPGYRWRYEAGGGEEQDFLGDVVGDRPMFRKRAPASAVPAIDEAESETVAHIEDAVPELPAAVEQESTQCEGLLEQEQEVEAIEAIEDIEEGLEEEQREEQQESELEELAEAPAALSEAERTRKLVVNTEVEVEVEDEDEAEDEAEAEAEAEAEEVVDVVEEEQGPYRLEMTAEDYHHEEAAASQDENDRGEAEEEEEEEEGERSEDDAPLQHSTSDLSVSAETPAALSDAERARKLALLRAEESWLESSLRARIRYLSGQE